MRTTFFLALITIIASAFWACKDNGTGPALQGGSSPYYPLAVGDVWVYNYYQIDSNGVIDLSSKWTDVKAIIGRDTDGMYLAYAMEELQGISKRPRNSFINTTVLLDLTFDVQGNLIQYLGTSSLNISTSAWTILANLSNHITGSTVTYEQQTPYDLLPYQTIKDTYFGETLVQVPAGSFNAAYYKDSTQAVYNEYNGKPYLDFNTDVKQTYYAAGVGMVKLIELTRDSAVTPGKPTAITKGGTYAELVSYSTK
ncbi:MAG TPA: hypothetical protein VFA55_02195 [Candidatus Kapabacteria bacterium]|nr:hypothetical protein [Candidatus Kapabacteria bacterium]